jgi:hypothetical protein
VADGVALDSEGGRPDQRAVPRWSAHCDHDLAEKGLPDWVIQAQVGHVAPEMMKTYSHIRREALNTAAAALEPSSQAPAAPTPPPASATTAVETQATESGVMSQSTSQSDVSRVV